MSEIDRRTFLKGASALTAGLAIGGPLQAFAAACATGAPKNATGYGRLVDKGDLFLPREFSYRIISRQGDPMTDGNPTPGLFDGMAAFSGAGDSTILIRNHENRRQAGETNVVVPADKRYDDDGSYNGGVTKLVVASDRTPLQSYALLGGTSTNCAGGRTPWNSWITCEEIFDQGGKPHGYIFEVDASATVPVDPVAGSARPVLGAGRFVHEAVAWLNGVLYETEDRSANSAFYRYLPATPPTKPGDLAASSGTLQALRVRGEPNAATDSGWPVGQSFPVDWVTIDDPNPSTDSVRSQAQAKGAAAFDRQEGVWVGDGKVYFDCTSGGGAGYGQIWQFDPAAQALTLVYESPGPKELEHPDNLVVAPTGDLFLCEDGGSPQFIRGLTTAGRIYDFARSDANGTEFAGACFDPAGTTLFVNQQGNRSGTPGVTYAVWGPWQARKA